MIIYNRKHIVGLLFNPLIIVGNNSITYEKLKIILSWYIKVKRTEYIALQPEYWLKPLWFCLGMGSDIYHSESDVLWGK